MKTMVCAASLSAGNEEDDHLFEASNGAATVSHKAARPLQMIDLTVLTALSTFSFEFLGVK